MVRSQAGLELRMILRNGEQLLLTVVIPVLVLTVFSSIEVMDLGTRQERIDFLAPGVLALAVMSTAFTGLAIGTGFERRYGALKRLGATPLPRWGLLVSKTLAVLVVEVLQIVAVCAVAFALGWSPQGSFAAVAVLMLAGTAAFSALGLLMAGTLRAEATLAAANLVYLLLPGQRRHRRAARPLPRQRPAGAGGAAGRCAVGGSARGAARRCPADVTHVAVLVVWAAVAGPADRPHVPLGVGTRCQSAAVKTFASAAP